ncbi:MAG: prolipoprotein diacylglyceryl transferase [Coriobacteriia bacterium]|nr:prolipoprotein diacylglyceryl transferase [Coriobacteriia bacterium]
MLDEIYHALDPIAFQIGPFAVRWYGIGYILGIALGMLVVYRTAKRWGVKLTIESVLTVTIAAAIGIIFGARIGSILFYNLEYHLAHPLDMFTFANGGMSFHGGLIGMVLAVIIAARLIKLPTLTLGDLIVIGAPIGIFLVRIANFINGELWGAVTDVPWGVVFETGGSLPRHPSQLYEALLEGAVLFAVLFVLSRRKPPFSRGSYLGVFMLLYGVFRIAVEFVRQPDANIGYLLGTNWLTMGMVLSTPMILVGIGFLVYAFRTRLPQAQPNAGEPTGADKPTGAGQPTGAKQPTDADKPTGANEPTDADKPTDAE